MTDAWARFWTAMAVMAFSAATMIVATANDGIGSFAEWFAAIGTTAGVFAAIYIAARSERERREASAARVKALMSLVTGAYNAVRPFSAEIKDMHSNEVKGTFWLFRRDGRLVPYIAELERLDVVEMPTTLSVDMLLDARRILARFDKFTQEDAAEDIVAVASLTTSELVRICEALARHVVKLGGRLEDDDGYLRLWFSKH